MVTDALLLGTPTQLRLAQNAARQVLQLSSFSESKAGSSSRSLHSQMAASRTAGTVCSAETAACTLEKPFVPSCFISFEKGTNLPRGGPFHFTYSNKMLLKVQKDFTAKTSRGFHGLTPKARRWPGVGRGRNIF